MQKNVGAKLSPVSLDTFVDLGKVDVYPSFKACDSILDIEIKNRCFNNQLYTHLSASLLAHTFEVSSSIDEVVKVKLQIDNKGSSKLMEILASDNVGKQLPMLDSLIGESVRTLPKLFPATKMGIPVTTVYEIPIVIKIK
ncbi:hypothetical protein ACFLRU_02390 [Bacteroidota bacterium]